MSTLDRVLQVANEELKLSSDQRSNLVKHHQHWQSYHSKLTKHPDDAHGVAEVYHAYAAHAHRNKAKNALQMSSHADSKTVISHHGEKKSGSK